MGATNMMDFINMKIAAQQKKEISLEEWTEIRRHGTPEEVAEAVMRMEMAGGYGNLV